MAPGSQRLSHLQLLPTPARPPQTCGYNLPTSDEAPGTEDQTKVHLSTTLRLLLRHCFETQAALASLPLPATLLPPNAGIVGICYWTPKTFCSQKRSLIDFSFPDKIISPYFQFNKEPLSAERGRARLAFSPPLVLTSEPHALQSVFPKIPV